MAKRSLKASPAGIAVAKRAFERREWTQEYLASAVGLQTRQSIWKFFTGRPIERYLFIDICFQLDLDWEEIVDRPPLDDGQTQAKAQQQANAVALAETWASLYPQLQQQLTKQYASIEHLLDIQQPVSVKDLYIERCIIAQPQVASWLDANSLKQQNPHPEQADFREIPFLNQPPTQVENWHPTRSIVEPPPYRASQLNLNPVDTLKTSRLKTDRLQADNANSTDTAENDPSKPALENLLQKYQRVALYGAIGIGKSMELQALAYRLIEQPHPTEIFPLRLSLDNLQINQAETGTSLAERLKQACMQCAQTVSQAITVELWQWLLEKGKVVLLFDGFDQISTTQQQQFQQGIQELGSQYTNIQIIIASRGNQQIYPFPGFTSVALEPLNEQAIRQFADRWFQVITAATHINMSAAEAGPISIAKQFLLELSDKRNLRLQSLATSPLLLHILCCIFRDCQALPTHRSRLYQHILELYLGGWDQWRHIIRSHCSPKFSETELISILSELAYTEFAAENYYFEKNKIIAILADALTEPVNTNNPHPESQQGDAEIVSHPEAKFQQSELLLTHLIVDHGILIESAKGIYCFAHQAFQEYLSARFIFTQTLNRDHTSPANSPHLSPLVPLLAQKLHHSGWQTQQALYHLAQQAMSPRWHEIILLTLDLLPNRNHLHDRLKRQIDRVILIQPRFKTFFQWIEEKVEAAIASQNISTPLGRKQLIPNSQSQSLLMSNLDQRHHIAAIRAFYFSHTLNLGLDLTHNLDPKLAWQLPEVLNQDAQLIKLINWLRDFSHTANMNTAIQVCFALQAIVARSESPPCFAASLKMLQSHIVESKFTDWEIEAQQAWSAQLYNSIIKHYNMGHDWQWQAEEWQQLETYYWSNIFLLECLQRYPETNATTNRIYQLLKPSSLNNSSAVATLPQTPNDAVTAIAQ